MIYFTVIDSLFVSILLKIIQIKTLSSILRHLESDIRHLEQEKKSLTEKINFLEKAILSPSSDNVRDKALRRLISESPAPEHLKRMREDDETPEDDCHTPIMVSQLPRIISASSATRFSSGYSFRLVQGEASLCLKLKMYPLSKPRSLNLMAPQPWGSGPSL